MTLLCDSAIPALCIRLQTTKMCIDLKLIKGVAYGSQKMEMTPMPIHCSVDKQIMVYPHNEILFGHKKGMGYRNIL